YTFEALLPFREKISPNAFPAPLLRLQYTLRGRTHGLPGDARWKWIDERGKEYGIGRPYLDKDPPHIAPIDGKEYADKRGVNAKLAKKGNAAKSGVAKAAKPLQALRGRAEPKPL